MVKKGEAPLERLTNQPKDHLRVSRESRLAKERGEAPSILMLVKERLIVEEGFGSLHILVPVVNEELIRLELAIVPSTSLMLQSYSAW